MLCAAAFWGCVGSLHAADEKTGWWPPFVPDVPVPAAVEPIQSPAGGETLVIEGAECAGISGFRADWDRPIPLAADGATCVVSFGENFGSSPVAVWDDPAKPGAIACDAVHRSLLVRFPGAAEQIATAIGQGKAIVRVEIVVPSKGSELFPPQYSGPTGLSFLGDLWVKQEPQWHLVAWGLKQPWISDRELGPTYNAFINGAGYWAGFGARVPGSDRVAKHFGPAAIARKNAEGQPEGRVDITASLDDPEFGADLGARLRRLADCGFLVRKWEAYDASFWRGTYEWGTATGGRGLLLGAPKLIVHLGPGTPQTVRLPPPADVRTLATSLSGGKGGKPTAVMPTQEQIAEWIARFGRRQPAWMDAATWARTQQLWTLEKKPLPHGFPDTPEAYAKWIDALLAKPPRQWNGWDAPELGALPLRYGAALPAPLIEHLRLYWWAWLMPDRDTVQGFDYAGANYRFVNGSVGLKGATEYYAKTHDWRGNFSIYRSYCREMGTMNFNHWASAGTLLGGALLESPRAIAEGRHGLASWPLKTWCWFDGSTQESIDHYYFSMSLAAQKVFADFGPTVEDRLMGQAILAKSVGELASCLHPRLNRFTSSSGRTGIAYTLAIQDGLNHLLHTLLPEGALTDLGSETVGDGGALTVPVIGHEYPPGLVASVTLDGPWAPAWYGPAFAAKPVPYQMTASYKMWGGYGQTPLWKRSFQGRDYGVASIDIAQSETVPFLVHWRRTAAPVKQAADLGILIGRYGCNRTELLDSLFTGGKTKRNPNGMVGMQGGPLCTIQHRNRLIVLGSPAKGLPYGRLAPTEITSIQTTLGLITLHTGWELLLDGKPATLPVKAKAGQRLVIRDGVACVGIIPLPGTDLGRDVEVEVTADGVPTEMQGGGTLAEALRINAYNYRGAPLPKEQWSSDKVDDAWGGYCIQAADSSEFKDAAAFDAHLAKGTIAAAWNADKRQVDLTWSLGGDTMACTFVPAAPVGQPTSQALPERTVNGKWLYLTPDMDRECELSAMGTSGRFEKNGAIFEGEGKRMGYLLTDPAHGIYEAWNPFPDPSALALVVPGGGRIEPVGKVGITRITAFTKENRVEIDGAVPGPGRATVAALSGFPGGVQVLLNGQPVKSVDGKVDGKPVLLVPLDGKKIHDTEKVGEKLEHLRVTRDWAARRWRVGFGESWSGKAREAADDGAIGPQVWHVSPGMVEKEEIHSFGYLNNPNLKDDPARARQVNPPPGRYDVVIRLKVADNTIAKPLLTLWLDEKPHTIQANQIAAAGAYVEYRLPFEKRSPHEMFVSWKLSCTGEVETWLDQMALVPVP
jgi:hypothetical protein